MNGHSPEERRHRQLNRSLSPEMACYEFRRGIHRSNGSQRNAAQCHPALQEATQHNIRHRQTNSRNSVSTTESLWDSNTATQAIPPCCESGNVVLRDVSSQERRSVSRQDRAVGSDADLRRKALKEARQGNHSLAIAIYNELISRNPSNASDYNNRGLVYFQATQLDEAIADYNRAIELNPNLDSVYNNRANYYACRGQLLEAILDYDVAIDLNPRNVRAWINQGITFRELKMYERAIECFDAALTFEQLEGNVYAERGRTYHLWGDWNLAVADYIRAIDSLPISTSTFYTALERLRFQVELWLDDLLSPLAEGVE